MTLNVAIDAGHAKNTAGKRSPDDSLREFSFNSVVARYVREKLADYEGVNVKFTHDESGEKDVALSTRAAVANDWKADVFVSIHANAYGSTWNDANGIETFTTTSPTTESNKLAETIQRKLIVATGLRNRGVKRADFTVIYKAKMTAALVECGFMTNRSEANLLKSDAYRNKVADAIVDSLAEVYTLKRKGAEKVANSYVEVTVRVNGKDIGEVGELKAGVTRVPVRKVAEALGATVTYDSKTKTVDIVTKT